MGRRLNLVIRLLVIRLIRNTTESRSKAKITRSGTEQRERGRDPVTSSCYHQVESTYIIASASGTQGGTYRCYAAFMMNGKLLGVSDAKEQALQVVGTGYNSCQNQFR